MKIDLCRNGCQTLVTVAEHQGKYKPFRVDQNGTFLDLDYDGLPKPHDCPKSPYNLKRQQQQQQQQNQQYRNQTIPKQQDNNNNNNEPSYRRPLSDLINEHHNAIIKSYSNINEKIDKILDKINEESQKAVELWKIVDATAAKVGVYQMQTGLDELKKRQLQQGPQKEKDDGDMMGKAVDEVYDLEDDDDDDDEIIEDDDDGEQEVKTTEGGE